MAKKKTEQPSNQTTKQLSRPPVVVILGHIDHGKTTLLDHIRQTKVAAKEAGGITQKIGAYQIKIEVEKGKKKKEITFIDTPGHEAFAKMRGRGAQVADIAVLVIAADDGVMPQTKEAVAHAKAAKIQIVVAINKIDLKNADPKKAKGQLVKEGIVPEDQGGDTPVVLVSAKTGKGVLELLEIIGLVADLQELKSEPEEPLLAVVVESSLSPQQGPLATVIVKKGTLKVGGVVYAGGVEGKVKALVDDQGRRVKEATPGMPVKVLGFSKVPPVGTVVAREKVTKVVETAKAAKEVEEGDLKVILRADTQGSLEAIAGAVSRVKVKEKGVNVLLAGVGQIVDSDIYLAQSGNGVVLGFNVGSSPSVKKLAEDLRVGVHTFAIIYELLEVVEKLLEGAEELEKAKIKGEGEVIKTFALLSGDVVLGTRVTAGKIKYRDKVKVLRASGSEGEEEEIHQGRVRGLKLGKDEIPEAKEGQEVGVLIKPQIKDLKVKDKIVVI